MPVEFQATALFAAADGGHERDVLSGSPVLADESIPIHIFSFSFQRDIRGESAILMVRPAFHLESPTTIITYELPRRFGHTLLKRVGPADEIPAALIDPPRSLVAVAREASGIDRVIAVPPPTTLPTEAIDLAILQDDYRLWAQSPEQAQQILTAEVLRLLRSEGAGTGEWVIELLGPLMMVYCASDGALSEARILAMNEFTDELCRRLLRASAPSSPRGMEHRP